MVLIFVLALIVGQGAGGSCLPQGTGVGAALLSRSLLQGQIAANNNLVGAGLRSDQIQLSDPDFDFPFQANDFILSLLAPVRARPGRHPIA